MTILSSAYAFKYMDSGIELNTDPALPFVDITSVKDTPETRQSIRNREGIDGGFVDAEFYNTRTIVLDGYAYAHPDNIADYLFRLEANYRPKRSAHPFYFSLPGIGEVVYLAKSLGINYTFDPLISTGRVPIQFQLNAEDPTVYSADQYNETLTPYFSYAQKGRSYSRIYPLTYGGENDLKGNTAQIVNRGYKETTALIRLENITDPWVIHEQSGRYLKFDLDMSFGDYLEIDLRNRTVRMNGATNRSNALLGGSTWFMLEPGINTLRFYGSSSAASKVIVTYRHAYK